MGRYSTGRVQSPSRRGPWQTALLHCAEGAPAPVQVPSCRHARCAVHVFETNAGPYIVDTGWNTDDAFAALSAGLTQLGSSIGAVQGVLVTHIHPDHYGLAGRVREASGAWIALHPADAALIQDRYEEPTELLGRVGAMLRRMGVWSTPTSRTCWWRTASVLTCRDGTLRPSGRPGTPPVTCASGSRPIG